jgi:hypothetical protein
MMSMIWPVRPSIPFELICNRKGMRVQILLKEKNNSKKIVFEHLF